MIIDIFVTAYDYIFGIDRLARFEKDMDQFSNNQVVLIARSTVDPNKAFSDMRWSLQKKLLHQKNFKILHIDIGTVNELDDAVNRIIAKGNKIVGLSILAHGNPSNIFLSKKIEGTISNSSGSQKKENLSLLEKIFDKLEKEAAITLDSCSTGYIGPDGKTSIAQTIADLAKGRLVISPLTQTSTLQFDYEIRDQTLIGKFSDARETQATGLWGKIKNTFFILAYIFTNQKYAEDITVYNKAYPPTR